MLEDCNCSRLFGLRGTAPILVQAKSFQSLRSQRKSAENAEEIFKATGFLFRIRLFESARGEQGS